MKYYYIVLSSITAAQRLQRSLSENGIKNTMIHTPKRIADGGCGYSIIVSEGSLAAALKIAEKNAVKVKKTVLKD